ncbi:protein-arginine deiminase [Lachnotalea glycerini]|uniref:Protein-arginine deiminase n=1 Tax=Lachnotalea glycerini TaxID=1763509 RepID=A0A318EWN5_9FIRM|nr:protein-arginine deiminase domain-containing protein [Lachnotalea glycerini]PXV95486.1 protein-arginine deiminase [Lachnotalea glycerini]
MYNLADFNQVLLPNEKIATGLKDFDTFENILIYNQEVNFDLWRYLDYKPAFIMFTEIDKCLSVKWGDKPVELNKRYTTADYFKIWTSGGLTIKSNLVSKDMDDKKIIQIIDSQGRKKDFGFYVYRFSILADYYRKGILTDSESSNTDWNWGNENTGPVIMPQCSKEEIPEYRGKFQIKNMDSPINYPDSRKGKVVLILQLHHAIDPQKVMIYNGDGKLIIGGSNVRWSVIQFKTKNDTLDFYAYATQHPDRNFDGLIRIGINFAIKIIENEKEIFIPIYQEVSDSTKNTSKYPFVASVQFRVSPWIMTANTQSPRNLYVSEVPYSYFSQEGYISNQKFIDNLKQVIGDDKVKVIPEKFTRNDPWAQDETKFGYSEMPNKQNLDIILNSPRNRGLDVFPIYNIFELENKGYITCGGTGEKSSLDSFGNLDVTPPFGDYKFGRIYYGGCKDNTNGRRMMQAMREFLDAQIVQKPFQLYTDWLLVGHVDEMMSIIPAPKEISKYGFKILLSSPNRFYEILNSIKDENSIFFKDLCNIQGDKVETTVKNLKNNQELKQFNIKCQEYLDYNRSILIKELQYLDIKELNNDIIDIPALYYPDINSQDNKASAYMPGMVNLVVWENQLLIAKPFGAEVNGKCCMEEYVKSRLETKNLNLKCNFIDDWNAYHIQDGEVHCGTNMLRKPYSDDWWSYIPM